MSLRRTLCSTLGALSLALGAHTASAGVFVSIGPLAMGIGHGPGHAAPAYHYGLWGNSCANVGCTSAECGGYGGYGPPACAAPGCGGPGYGAPGYGYGPPQAGFPHAAPPGPCTNCGNPVGSTGYGYYPNSTTYWNQGVQRR
ncbi:MAG: hypothetical protein IT428_13035 [Planctomycetaceae bacterium]|nr:hypothetical protein [Planctomycetaceae bacterium]